MPTQKPERSEVEALAKELSAIDKRLLAERFELKKSQRPKWEVDDVRRYEAMAEAALMWARGKHK